MELRGHSSQARHGVGVGQNGGGRKEGRRGGGEQGWNCLPIGHRPEQRLLLSTMQREREKERKKEGKGEGGMKKQKGQKALGIQVERVRGFGKGTLHSVDCWVRTRICLAHTVRCYGRLKSRGTCRA